MKSAIIFVLLLALAAAAFFTRPSEADFKRYIVETQTQGDSNVLKAGWDQYQADQFVQHCTVNNRLFWTNVTQDGKTIYTGAFSHWFNRATIANDVHKVSDKIERVKQAAQS